ncbi:hypothetical protein IGJ83_003443 [Enterococcus pernyi]
MKKILILGANGKIAQLVTTNLIKKDNDQITLFLRQKERLASLEKKVYEIIEGNSDDIIALDDAIKNKDIIYANLSGKDIENQARNIVESMKINHVKRLIWVSTLGIYNEIPGEFGKFTMDYLSGGYIENYTKAAKIIEESGLDVTIIRPGWLDDYDEIDYEITHRNEPFKGTEVSRLSVADLITKIIENPSRFIGDSLGVNKPGMDYVKPKWLI